MPASAGRSRARLGGRSPFPIAGMFEYRPALGPVPLRDEPVAEAVTGGWLRLREPRAPDAPLLAQYLDAWWPAAFVRIARPAAVPTIDLTIHFRAPSAAAALDPAEPVHGPLHVADREGRLRRGGWRGVDLKGCCSRPRASSRWRASWHDHRIPRLGSNVGERRARLQATDGRRCGEHGVTVLAASKRLRDRSGRRGARPARLPQRRACAWRRR